MTGQKRTATSTLLPQCTVFLSTSTSSSSETELTKQPKHQVAVSTFEKWQCNYDREHQTLKWLRCDTDKCDKGLVAFLWCAACRQYEGKICSMKNFSTTWVIGTENQRTSYVFNHVACEQHKVAIPPRCPSQGKQGAGYELHSNCALSKENETVSVTLSRYWPDEST